MQISKTIKIALISGGVGLLLVGVGFLGFHIYLANQLAAEPAVTPTTTILQQKTPEQKELDQADADIKADDDLDMNETDDIMADLDSIDLQGI